jgi:mono/diheme cytochrome c family protein
MRGLLVVWLAGVVQPAVSAQGNPEAAKIKNPIPTSEASVAAGKAVYDRRCRVCHAQDGTGGRKLEDGPAASNLTDTTWDHGGSDGEIFTVIKHGIPPDLVMQAWEDRLSDEEIWNVVNFIRTLRK